MTGLYPVNVVVSTNASLARRYNAHEASSFFVSECVSPEQAAELLDSGALLNSIVVIDGEEAAFLDRLGDPATPRDEELTPKVRRIRVDASADTAVQQIHEALQQADFIDYDVGG